MTPRKPAPDYVAMGREYAHSSRAEQGLETPSDDDARIEQTAAIFRTALSAATATSATPPADVAIGAVGGVLSTSVDREVPARRSSPRSTSARKARSPRHNGSSSRSAVSSAPRKAG